MINGHGQLASTETCTNSDRPLAFVIAASLFQVEEMVQVRLFLHEL